MFTLMTLKFYQTVGGTGDPGRIDPLRVIQGVVGGIGFLGDGTIIEARGSVRGITTAAAIWVVGGFGIACGLGYYFLAGTGVFFSLLMLSGVWGCLDSASCIPSSREMPRRLLSRPKASTEAKQVCPSDTPAGIYRTDWHGVCMSVGQGGLQPFCTAR